MSERFTLGALGDSPAPAQSVRVRSDYVEENWIGFVGPLGLAVARRMDSMLANQASVGCDPAQWASHFGVSVEDLLAAMTRLERYGLAERNGGRYFLRRHWPEVPTAITTPLHKRALIDLDEPVVQR